MKTSRFTEAQIAFSLKQAELGTKVEEVCRKLGISEATFYNWKKKDGGVGPSELLRNADMQLELHASVSDCRLILPYLGNLAEVCLQVINWRQTSPHISATPLDAIRDVCSYRFGLTHHSEYSLGKRLPLVRQPLTLHLRRLLAAMMAALFCAKVNALSPPLH